MYNLAEKAVYLQSDTLAKCSQIWRLSACEKTASRLTAIFLPRWFVTYLLSGANIKQIIEIRFNSVYLLSNFKKYSLIMAEKECLHQRLKQAIVWLKQNKNILQLDIAEKMSMSTVGFSRGLARCKEKNDEDFVIKFHQATDEVFSLDWLLNGTGDKFADKLKKQEPQPVNTNVDFASYINALLAKSDETIASLKRELATKDDIIQAKDDRIADLTKLAEERLHRIAELRRVIDAHDINMSDYPFQVGVAENGSNRKNV